jgi:hypothetical protein
MSTIPLPPGLRVNGFSFSNPAVTRAHASPFGGDDAESVVDLLQDRWRASFTTTATTPAEARAIEAWLNAQRGGANTTPLWHMGSPVPLGTLGRVYPVAGVSGDVPQGSDLVYLATVPGATLLAGDMLRLGGDANGTGGLLVQCAADCVANGVGTITVPLANRVRRALVGHRRASAATYVDAGGVLQTAAANVLRYQGDVPLVEAAGTNLLANSQNLAGPAWTGIASASAAAELYRGAAPFWTIAKTLSSAAESRGQAFAAVTAGDQRTLTFALLAGSVDVCNVGLFSDVDGWDPIGANGTFQVIEGPGTATSVFWGGALPRIENLSPTLPTLIRVTRTYVAGGGASVQIYPGTPDSVTVGHSIKATRVQVEAGAAATSYIPTTTAPATRAADVITPVEWTRPARPFRLATRTGLRHVPGYAEGLALDFVEDLQS